MRRTEYNMWHVVVVVVVVLAAAVLAGEVFVVDVEPSKYRSVHAATLVRRQLVLFTVYCKQRL